MTKAELVNEIAISTGYDKTSIGVVLESFMEIVKKERNQGRECLSPWFR